MIKSVHFELKIRQCMNDFLEKAWSISKLYVDSNFKKATSSDIAAIILSANPSNYDRFVALNSFKDIFLKLNLELNKYSIQLMQIGILNAIKNSEIKKEEIQKKIEVLSKNNIITFKEFKFINDFIINIEVLYKKEDNVVIENLIFHKNIATLNMICNELRDYKHFENRLNTAYESANNSKFFIAVTGVVNAGKSSALNALIGRDILGVSNVPETANLSVITYSENDFITVNFWDSDEIKAMGLEARTFNSVQKISQNELKYYTAAASEISPYVKEIILGVNLDMLKDGINIVDTPGLDDAVILREQLTRKYMQESDFILHLMNASQSVTKKDISFICDTLKNGKSGGLIVVLTHIDTLNSEDLDEVLTYTKNSIRAELNEYGFDKTLAQSVSFFAISSVNKVGINELKKYIYDSFFGKESKKANIIIDNYKKELLHITQTIKDESQCEFVSLGAHIEDLNKKTLELQNEVANLGKNLNQLTEEMDKLVALLDYSDLNELSSLKSISANIKDRIISDIKYAKSKKQKVEYERIGVICESGFQDAFIDFFRDFKNKISKDIYSSYETINLKINIKNKDFYLPDIREYIDKNTPKINYDELKYNLNAIIRSESDIEIISTKITILFDEFLASLKLKDELANLSNFFTFDFIEYIKLEISLIQGTLKLKEDDLASVLDLTKSDIQIQEQNKKELEEKLARLENIYNGISAC